MAKRTKSLLVQPWSGGLNTSTDESLIPASSLTVADNIVVAYNDEKRRREGINYNWDNAIFRPTHRSSSGTTRTLTGSFANLGINVDDYIALAGCEDDDYNGTSLKILSINATTITYEGPSSLTEASTPEEGIYWANKVIGGSDFWFGSEDAKAQWIVFVLDNGMVFYVAAGVRSRLTVTGTEWETPLTEANCEVFENRLYIAVNGLNNVMKYWNGDTSRPLSDVPANIYAQTGVAPNIVFKEVETVGRKSSGTTRYLKIAARLDNNPAADHIFNVGDKIIITGGPAAYEVISTIGAVSWDGTYSYIEYSAPTSLTEDDGGGGYILDDTMNIGVDAPRPTFIREHSGILWCNDKTRLDRVHYSGNNGRAWWGYDGISGATDVGDGDGDPNGVTGIAPSFKGVLFVGKRTKLYRIDISGGDTDNLSITEVSKGVGFISHQGIVAIDQEDIFFVSDRGFHSISATDAYGDFSGAFISKDIQRTFVNDFTPGRKRLIKAAYLPEINSALFSVSENGSSQNNAAYLFNVQNKVWYKWTNIQAEAIIPTQDPDRRRIYLGTYQGRLAQTQTSFNKDVLYKGESLYIHNKIATGLIFPEGRPDVTRQYKAVRLIFKADGSYTITCKVRIDNFSEQAMSFISNESAVPLGTMVLGSDTLGGSFVTAPYSLPIDGIGRGIKLVIEQNDANTALSLQGFVIEYLDSGAMQETRLGDSK